MEKIVPKQTEEKGKFKDELASRFSDEFRSALVKEFKRKLDGKRVILVKKRFSSHYDSFIPDYAIIANENEVRELDYGGKQYWPKMTRTKLSEYEHPESLLLRLISHGWFEAEDEKCYKNDEKEVLSWKSSYKKEDQKEFGKAVKEW